MFCFLLKLCHLGVKLKIAIIGASGAIGKALVELYAQQSTDNQVTAFTRNPTDFSLPQVNNSIVDYSSEQSLQQCAKQAVWDIVIVAIGILHDDVVPGPEKVYKQLTEKNLQHILTVNTIYPAMVAKHFLPQLNKYQSVLAMLSARVGSISDNRKGGWYAYRASKAALNMLIKNFAIETHWQNKNAIVIGLHPGTVDSQLSKPFQMNISAEKLFSPQKSAKYLAKVISSANREHSGQCVDWQGKLIEP